MPNLFKLTPVLLACSLALCFTADPAPAQNLLFKSGFEETVYLDPEFIDDDGFSCEQSILGMDQETGFSWPIEVLGGTGRLHLIGHDYHQALEAEIQTVIGPDGNPTRALFMVQHHGSPVGNIGQCPYSIADIADGTGDLYIRYWIKINADYVENINGRGSWRTFFEWKSQNYASGDGFRLIAFIYLDEGSDTPYWHWQGDADPQNPIWQSDNTAVPVPIGQWFLTEFYWHWSEGPDGRALWKINNQVIGDHYGPTTRNSEPIDFIMLTQIYGSADDGVVTPKHQWIDDIEIWDGIPTLSGVEQELTSHYPITINPNPSSGDFHIKTGFDDKSMFAGRPLGVYSLSGTLVDRLEAGTDGYFWRTRSVPSGVYIVIPEGASSHWGQKLVLVR